jgi:hypothetical protein
MEYKCSSYGYFHFMNKWITFNKMQEYGKTCSSYVLLPYLYVIASQTETAAGLNLAHSQFYQSYCKYLYTLTHMHAYICFCYYYDQYSHIINTATQPKQMDQVGE